MSKAPEHLSQQELEAYLWGVAKLLRGLMDAGDYKQYVFPMLFFKRLADVWDEESENAFDETGDEDFARDTANDRFTIPEGAHWKDARDASRDVGRALLNAYQAIEAANPQRLQGVFGNAAWTDKAQMPDETLKNLIEQHRRDVAREFWQAYFQQEGDLDFHYRIVLGSGNQRLVRILCDDLYHLARMYRCQFGMKSDRARDALKEHAMVVDAIAERDGELAEWLMRRHVRASRKSVELRLAAERADDKGPAKARTAGRQPRLDQAPLMNANRRK